MADGSGETPSNFEPSLEAKLCEPFRTLGLFPVCTGMPPVVVCNTSQQLVTAELSSDAYTLRL